MVRGQALGRATRATQNPRHCPLYPAWYGGGWRGFLLDKVKEMEDTEHMMNLSNEELRQLRAWSFEAALGIHSMNQANTPSKAPEQRRQSIDLDAVLKDAKKITNYVRSASRASAAESNVD